MLYQQCLILLFIAQSIIYSNGSNFFNRRYRKEEVNYRQIEKNILDEIMGPKIYDARIRPAGVNGTDEATFVYVNIFFRSFSKIDDVKMEYSFQITLRQQWNDVRLKFKDKLQKGHEDKIRYLTMTDEGKVWMPDTFFRNEKIGAFHSILTPNLYIRVFPNGDVLYSIRIMLLKGKIIQYLDSPNYKTSFVQVDLTFARELSFYIVTIYIPCFMIVVVSWFSFWLDYKAVPARVALGVTTLLAMSTTMGSIQRSLPPVAYTKAIDVWTGFCVFFVFSALLEYALVNYASRSDAQRAAKQKERKEKELEFSGFNAERIEDSTNASMDPLLRRIDGAHLIPAGSILPGRVRRSNRFTEWMRNFQFQAKKIDVLSRILFPSTFALFNCLYWSYYLTRSHGKQS
ncbi:glutamate-gated chloride channel [Eurytemora carolleeae]|uniref:glutamate-gated chloride channel n=1 Tax=Eurytemora carolleeae TaxID=1294199 RepID=UPI000C78CC03|nr:glutamate-gated chloride channel [Eurytemora carolleeae]|eukprot:XP_023331534.1 glutamate-gated chloride channel-like [Eurytemora affinis]